MFFVGYLFILFFLAEVHIRELKRKLYKYFMDQKTKRYIDVLQDFATSLNARVRKKTGFAPKDVSFRNSGLVLQKRYPNLYYGKRRYPFKFKFGVGDHVRMSLHHDKLRHGYLENYSDEIYVISRLLPTDPPTYKLSAQNGEEIEGRFYFEELIKVKDIAPVVSGNGA